MKILPWITEEFRSPLDPKEVLDRVRQNIAPPAGMLESLLYLPVQPFDGSVSGGIGGGSFDVHRITGSRNSLQPLIDGWVTTAQNGQGSLVRIQHKMPDIAALITLTWGASAGFAWAKELVTSLFSGVYGVNLFVGAVAIGVPSFVLLRFWSEVDKSRSLLVKILRLEFVAKV